MNPNVVDAPDARLLFQLNGFTVTDEPLTVSVPLHNWVMVWPLGSVQVTVQELIAAAPAFTVTSAWKPPGHQLITL
jgi:hypothetical protein